MNIIFKGKDNSIAIMILAPNADKEDAIKKFKDAHPDFYDDYFEGEFEFPESRIFRDAWRLSRNKVVVDKRKAQKIHLERIRKARNEKLEELDKETLRYFSDEVKLKAIEKKKQKLRDIPQNLDLKNLDLNNPEWPKELTN